MTTEGDDFQFLRIKRLSRKTTGVASTAVVISTVMRHNLREIQAEFGARAGGKIDPQRICDNVVLFGAATAADVAERARAAMRDAGVEVRKNATVGIEIIVSLPADTAIDCRAYFEDAARWVQAYFAVPGLSAVIHNDEDNPHMHVVLLPLRDDRLVATELLGDRAAIKTLQKQFYDQVSARYGLRQAPPPRRYSAAVRQSAIDAAFMTLETNSGLNPDLLHTLLAPHLKNPAPLLAALGLSMPDEKVAGSFVATMTRPCKTPIGDSRRGKTPIGNFDPGETQNTYVSVRSF